MELWSAGLLFIGFMAIFGFMARWFTVDLIYGLLVYLLLDLWPVGLLFIGFIDGWLMLEL